MTSVFTQEEFNSEYGFLTSIWGPSLWFSLHIISFTYPENPTKTERDNYYDFFKSLKNILPCKMCQKNLKKNLKVHKLNKKVFKSRYTLSLWVYELHEIVNKMLKKKKSGLSYDDVRNMYENFRAHCVIEENGTPESGCKEPLYGVYSKCQLNIVPDSSQVSSLKINPACLLRRK
jgi:hypothetical protein